jgi:hypothetical protein
MNFHMRSALELLRIFTHAALRIFNILSVVFGSLAREFVKVRDLQASAAADQGASFVPVKAPALNSSSADETQSTTVNPTAQCGSWSMRGASSKVAAPIFVSVRQTHCLPGKKKWLRPGTRHLLGRTTGKADDPYHSHFIDQKSVSRKHLLITVSEQVPEEWVRSFTCGCVLDPEGG